MAWSTRPSLHNGIVDGSNTPISLRHQYPAPPVEMGTKAVIETETQLPFAVDQAVLEQVAEFLQQQASGPPEAPEPPSPAIPTAIDF